jgi:ppGpp synthetase/RelA/SpoT-type nucleotidyltranferase
LGRPYPVRGCLFCYNAQTFNTDKSRFSSSLERERILPVSIFPVSVDYMIKTSDKLPNMHSTEYRGLPIVIQWPKNSIRVGKHEDGTEFKSEMKADYGYIPNTTDADNDDHLDVYIGPDENAEHAYVVEQLKNDGSFDEYKVMIGFDSLEDAEEMYALHAGEDRIGEIEEIPFDDLLEKFKGESKTAAKSSPEVLAREQFPPGNEHNERTYILQDGTILNCDDMDHFTVENFYDGKYEDEDAINKFLGDTGALRTGYYEGTFLIHGGGRAPTKQQLNSLVKLLNYWENSVTAKWMLYTPKGEKDLPEFSRPGEIRRELATLYGVEKVAGEHTLVEAFIKNYEHEVDFYQEVAGLVQDKLDSALQDSGIKAVVSSRAKRPSRLEKKLYKRAPEKNYRTFRNITDDIVDLAGCRVALYMPADREEVGALIQELFTEVRPVRHFPADRGPNDSLGYIADHYLVTLKPETLRKKELRYADTQVEIQVASVLMHAWAEVTHDLIYKPEKGKLTPEEMKLLKDLNDLVQMGEQQLEKLQNAIEHRTSEDLKFDIVGALQSLAKIGRGDVEEFKLQASKIAGRPIPPPPPVKSQWTSYLKARLATIKSQRSQ